MTTAEAHLLTPSLDLPSAYTLVVQAGKGAFAQACQMAKDAESGTLVWAPGADALEFAVVLAPEEPLRSARRAFFIGMSALGDAIASVSPPEKRISFDWPDTILFDGARLGGGRLGWPQDCREDETPQWLVFSAMLLASKRDAGDPGLTPDSTSLEDEHCATEGHGELIERFARYLLRNFDLTLDQGFAAVGDHYLWRLVQSHAGARPRIEENGDLLVNRAESSDIERLSFVSSLEMAAWLDPKTGMPRL